MYVVSVPESALEDLTATGPTMFFGRAYSCPGRLRVVEHRNIDKRLLDDEDVRADLLAWAGRHGSGVVECHTHVDGDPACMSWTDVAGLVDWVPHVRWRIGGRPYAALVLGQTTVDGLVWVAPDRGAERVDAVLLGCNWIPTTGRSVERFRSRTADDALR